MSLKKYISFFALVLAMLSASAQNEPVFLKWKINPGETISYKAIMEDKNESTSVNVFDGLTKGTPIDSTSTKKINEEMNAMVKQMQEQMSNLSAILKKEKNGIIEVNIVSENHPASTNNSINMFLQATNGVLLRGSFYEDGSIASFYTKPDQKNLLAVMFELPAKSIKVGDSWPLSVNFLSFDQAFKCDSAFKKNVVTVEKIENKGDDKVVTLKYDIVEYAAGTFMNPFNSSATKMSMKMGYNGTATFSLERGRWLTFKGILFSENVGMMEGKQSKKIELIPKN